MEATNTNTKPVNVLTLFKKKRRTSQRSELPLYLMLIPALVVTFIFSYIPMYGIVIAFQDFKAHLGLFGVQTWVGMENFNYFFNMPEFKTVLFNSLYIAILKIVTGLFVPVVFALMLNEMQNQFTRRTIQTAIYLPHFLSWVILGGVLSTVLSQDGILNQFLNLFGVESIFFLGDNRWFPWTIIVSHHWKEFGWGTILYLAAITNIDPSLYEAARIDGANKLKQTWHVTIPGISHIIILSMTLSLGSVLNAGFDQVFNLYSPVVYASGDIIDTLVYRIGVIQAQYSLSTAVNLFKSFISLILITISYSLAYKTTGYRIF